MSHLGIRDDGPGQPPWCRGNATAVPATSKTAIAAGTVVLNRPPITRETDSSNPSPSSGESRANLSLAGIRLPHVEKPRVCGSGRAARSAETRRTRQHRAYGLGVSHTCFVPVFSNSQNHHNSPSLAGTADREMACRQICAEPLAQVVVHSGFILSVLPIGR